MKRQSENFHRNNNPKNMTSPNNNTFEQEQNITSYEQNANSRVLNVSFFV